MVLWMKSCILPSLNSDRLTFALPSPTYLLHDPAQGASLTFGKAKLFIILWFRSATILILVLMGFLAFAHGWLAAAAGVGAAAAAV